MNTYNPRNPFLKRAGLLPVPPENDDLHILHTSLPSTPTFSKLRRALEICKIIQMINIDRPAAMPTRYHVKDLKKL